MISSQHHDKKFSGEETKQKPEIILEYNRTKGGVDVLDLMCRNYSTRSMTRRWTLVHFQNLLDIAAINTMTVYEQCHPGWSGKRGNHGRRFFLQKLSEELCLEHMRYRLTNRIGLHCNIIAAIKLFVPDSTSTISSTEPDDRPVSRCALCRASGKLQRLCNSTKAQCQLCDRPVCGKHSQTVGYVCNDCC